MAAEVSRLPHFHSKVSLQDVESSGTTKLRGDERAKLTLLVKTWKTKYEKANHNTLQHVEYIKELETDVGHLRKENQRITETLTSRLNEEKEKHMQEIVQLKTEKTERIEHSSDKADFFRQEMERVANEAESGIAYYKNRDEEMEEKMMMMQGTIDDLKDIIRNLKLERHQYISEHGGNPEEIKAKFMVQIVKMKDLCAEKVEEAKQRIKEAEDKSKEIAFKYEKESNDVEEKIQQKVLEAKLKLEKDHKENIEKLNMDHEKEIQTLLNKIPSNNTQSNRNPSNKTLSNETQSNQIFPNEAHSNRTPSNENLSNRTPSNKTLSNANPSKEIPSNANPSNKIFPNETLSNQIFPNEAHSNQTPTNETLSNRTFPNETHSNRTLPNETHSNRTLPNETHSNRTLPNGTPSNEAHLNRTLPNETHSNRTLPNETHSNRTPSNETLSNRTFPNETLSNQIFPNETLSNQIFPNETHSNRTPTNKTLSNEIPLNQTITKHQKFTNMDCQDKATMVDLDDHWFKEERDSLDKDIREATTKLKRYRLLYYNSFFWEFDGKGHNQSPSELSYTTMSDLTKELSICQQRLREIKNVLDRYDQPRRDRSSLERLQLLIEIDFNTKVLEIEYIRKLIRMKRVQRGYRPAWSPIGLTNASYQRKPHPPLGCKNRKSKLPTRNKTQSKPNKPANFVVPKTVELKLPPIKPSPQTKNLPPKRITRLRKFPTPPPITNRKLKLSDYQSPYAQSRLNYYSTLIAPKFPVRETKAATITPRRKVFLPKINTKKPKRSLNKRSCKDNILTKSRSTVQLFPTINGRQYYENQYRKTNRR